MLAAGLSASCAAKAKRAFVPPRAPVPKPATPAQPGLESAPELALVAAGVDLASVRTVQELWPVLPPYRQQSRPARAHKVQPQTPAPTQAAAPATPTEPAPTLQLESMLSPEQENQLKQQIDGSLYSAQQNLAKTRGRALDQDQRETARQIESFIKQAQATRASDLEAARSLAERADLLSRDLVKSLR